MLYLAAPQGCEQRKVGAHLSVEHWPIAQDRAQAEGEAQVIIRNRNGDWWLWFTLRGIVLTMLIVYIMWRYP